MAYSTNLAHANNGLTGWVGGMFASLRDHLAKRQVYRVTLNELRSLSNRELADLGLNQSMLPRIAWQAAYEAD